MSYLVRPSARAGLAVCLVIGGMLHAWTSVLHAQGNVVMALDGMIVNNSGGGQLGWGGFGRFQYAQQTTTITVGPAVTAGLGRYDAFTIAEPGIDGSGVGVNFTVGNINSPVTFVGSQIESVNPVTSDMFPLLDLATFGTNFNPEEYVAELVYKPLEGNTSTQLNVTLDTVDGFDSAADTGRAGEQWQWGFFDLVNTYNNTSANGDLDEDGFAVAQSNMGVLSQAAANFTGQSFMYTVPQGAANPVGDGAPDFNDFEGETLAVPNGAVQIHLQTVYDANQTPETGTDNWEIKALRIRKINPDPREVARLDGKSGFSLRFGSPFERTFDGLINIGGVDYDPPVTDQLIRFDENGFLPNNSFIINTDDSDSIGGAYVWQSAASTVFDATDATVEVRARLTAPLAEQAESIQVLVKDKDGNGTTDVGDFGGEEYVFTVPLASFNETTMTTLSLPFSAATIQQAQEFATAGDGLLTDFNLYSLGIQILSGAGLVDLEVESIRVMLAAPPGVPGDYNNNGTVDAADYVLWRNGGPLENDPTQGVEPEDYDFWRARFGNASGGGLGGGAPVPEPASFAFALVALLMGASVRRR